jgi:hypothetical protein
MSFLVPILVPARESGEAIRPMTHVSDFQIVGICLNRHQSSQGRDS